MREIVQLHYENWPDFGVPTSTKPIRDLLVLMTKFRERAAAASLDGPIVVHCSAGVGRTGCLIASHIAIEKAKRGEEFNIKKIVEQLRRERHPTMVKTEDQYFLVYAVVKDVLTKSSIL
jgi:protein tyrosine phosphatase